MYSQEQHGSNELDTEERRKEMRVGSSKPLRVLVDTTDFGGRADNLSEAGVFFFSGDQLRVTVEIEVAGRLQTHQGHIVRVQRMSDETTGFAIEFDQ